MAVSTPIEKHKRDTTRLRFETYVSGRLLFDKGLLFAAQISLHHAVRLSYLALIGEQSDHVPMTTFQELVSVTRSQQIGRSITASDDFLRIVGRCGGDETEVLLENYDIVYFDNLMIQLNALIVAESHDPSSDLIRYALNHSNRHSTRVFFHQNYDALQWLSKPLYRDYFKHFNYELDVLTYFKEMQFLIGQESARKFRTRDFHRASVD